MNIEQILEQASCHYKVGEFQEAESLCPGILTEDPFHPDANHNLGIILKQGRQLEPALVFFKTALEANPNQGQFWVSYIDTLIHLGRYNVARSILDQGQSKGLKGDVVDQLVDRLDSHIEIKNQTSPSRSQIDNVLVLYSNGQVQEALDAIAVLAKSYPNDALLYNISGACYKILGQQDTAIKHYEAALVIKPDFADAHNNLGVVLEQLKEFDLAVKSYEQALAIKPDFADA